MISIGCPSLVWGISESGTILVTRPFAAYRETTLSPIWSGSSVRTMTLVRPSLSFWTRTTSPSKGSSHTWDESAYGRTRFLEILPRTTSSGVTFFFAR